MNIGSVYIDLSWAFWLVAAAIAALFLSARRIRRLYARRSGGVFWEMGLVVLLTTCCLGVVVYLFALYAVDAPHDYDRETTYTCDEQVQPFSLPPGQSRLFVVARYKENITWLNCPAFRHERVLVYQKELPAGSEAAYLPPGSWDVQVVPNLGFECASYAQYLADHYDDMPDYVFFLQGSPFDHCATLQRALHDPRLYTQPFYLFSGYNVRITNTGRPHFLPQQGLGPVIQHVYQALFGQAPPEHLRTYFHGQFMATRATVHRHPRAFYQRMLHILLEERDPGGKSWNRRGDGWLECSAFERLWQKVFLDVAELPPYEPDQALCPVVGAH